MRKRKNSRKDQKKSSSTNAQGQERSRKMRNEEVDGTATSATAVDGTATPATPVDGTATPVDVDGTATSVDVDGTATPVDVEVDGTATSATAVDGTATPATPVDGTATPVDVDGTATSVDVDGTATPVDRLSFPAKDGDRVPNWLPLSSEPSVYRSLCTRRYKSKISGAKMERASTPPLSTGHTM
ncbi:caM kinase-like vesicle-associated protein [Procambarus clarkii]|uniref:caM kinase-like vesicle-associated protein n=1 Tax=Procambarus clarkii TaxID=6728 RepID=UPI0037430055